ncbi:MAG: hypothetical protein AB8C46_04885 [Burkholderiaceae bacterium]
MSRFSCVLSILFISLPLANVLAQERRVVINGERLNSKQLAQADAAQCTRVPNGYYWWHPKTGAWGYWGNFKIQGYVGDGCRQSNRSGRRKSLSERGLLYTPGDLNFR